MNIIFLDFDGVLNTIHKNTNEDIEERIKILAEICKEYNCKVVIEASAKNFINYETMQATSNWLKLIVECFKKYDIKCIGKTPDIQKKLDNGLYRDIWKEDEIIEYLKCHPEVKHYCVIDDDDAPIFVGKSDLDKVRDHLVKTIYYSNNSEEEGLLPIHKNEVGKILKLEREIY